MINKLKSNRGATMILALALFLICAVISSLILAAAASGTTRITQQTKEQQAYLAVSSATDIVAAELDNCNKYIAVNEITDEINTDTTGVLGSLVKTAAFYVCKNNTAYTDVITVSLELSDGRLPNATCTFKMDTDYGMELIVKTADSNYSTVIRCKATVNTDEELDASGNVTETTLTVTWGAPDVTKGVGN